MTTGIASGLGATWGFAKETTWGTYVAPTRHLPFTSDKVVGSKKTVQSQALHGSFFELSNRRRLTYREAKGPVELDLTDRQLGLLIEQMLGSTPTITQQGTTEAYLQVHTPGTTLGKSLSLQSGRPEVTTGTIQPFTYPGAKCTEWEVSVDTAGLAKLMCTFDAVNEVTTEELVAASYVPDGVLAFVDGTLLLGGTLTTTGGVWSVATGALPVGTVSAVSVKGSNVLAVDRQQIGSITKSQQLVNAFRKYTGSFEVEFANLTDVYDAYYADTPVTLQLNFTGQEIATDIYAQFNVLCPSIRFNGTPPSTDGPAILKFAAPFDILTDEVHPAIQIGYMSLTSAV